MRTSRCPISISPWPVLTIVLVAAPSGAQTAPRFPPPVKGEYACAQIGAGLGTRISVDPDGTLPGGTTIGGVNYNYFSPQVQLQPSALNTLLIDGKGNYTVTGLKAGGTYRLDPKTNTLRYTGPLAQLGAPAYGVSSDGLFSISFDFGGARNSCELKVKGNPLPALKNANGRLPGRVLLSNLNGTNEYSAADGTYLQGTRTPLAVRDPQGRLLYILSGGYEQGELVLEDRAGRTLGGFAFSSYSSLDLHKNWASLSPDGQRVALYRRCPVVKGEFVAPDCLAIVSLGGRPGEILASTLNITSRGGPAAWTRDGRIVYSGKDGRLCLADPGLKNETRLTEREGRFPATSPDGKRVAYISGNAVYVQKLDGGNVRKIDQGASAEVWMSAPAWSPDGKYLLSLVGRGVSANVWVNPLEGGRQGYVLKDTYGQLLNASSIERLSWWPGQ